MIRTHSLFERLARLALAVMVCVAAAVASAAPGDPDLRWILSPSEEAVGYIVYVGDESGFFSERASVAQLDIGSNYTLVDGVAHYPLGDLISQSAWVVMTAYDSEGLESAGSNEIFAQIAVTCAVDADCDDDNVCNGSEICSGGTCSSTTPPVCASAGPCSVASCDPLTGCSVENLPNGSQCNDGDPSTVNDSCQAGSCRGDGVPEPQCATDNDCGDADACNGAERCVAGSCVTGTPLVCAGSDQCTFASCNPALGCVVEPAPNGLWCDDGDATTSADVCSAGFCAGEVSPDDSSEPFYFEDFEAFSDGADPIGWLDTAGGSFDEPADDFYVAELSDGNHVMQTESWDRDIHSHLLDGGSAGWSGYEFSGRMQIDRGNAGIGVTLYSDFPNAGLYYRLSHYGPYSFQLAGHPDGEDQCIGDTDTYVVPDANRWYAFRFRAFPEGGGTRVQAKVWDSETPEPASWQADCWDPAATALTGGAPGLLSQGIGVKSWDDLAVRAVSNGTGPAPDPECATNSDCGDADACNGAERCVSGSCVTGTPLVCAGSDQCSFSACDPALGCVVEPLPDGRACNDQNLCTGPDRCQAGVCSSGSALSCPAANECQVGLCDPFAGCSVENLPNGSRCNDGDPSTVNDSCQAGSCRGDGVPEPECATDNDCGDADACNGAERCVSGSCVTGTPLVCAGSDQCTFASCNPALGCVVEPAPNGLWCDDGDATTSADVCSAGFCAGEVSPDDSSEPFYFEDFEAFSDGADPIGWLDTAGGSFDEPADDFYVAELSDGNHVMQTESWDRDIHSHLLDGGSAGWSGYEFSGRMQIDRGNAGIGVTLYSDFPNAGLYYRLSHYGPYSFQLAGHPDGEDQCIGDTDTYVVPDANRWYAFRFRAFPEGGGTRVQAKVWDSETPEPASWQADCWDPAATALTGGAPGLSSQGIGVKSWDDLEVHPVSNAAGGP